MPDSQHYPLNIFMTKNEEDIVVVLSGKGVKDNHS